MMTIEGKKVSAVINARICRVKLYSCEPSGFVVMVTAESPPVCAQSEGATSISSKQHQLSFIFAPLIRRRIGRGLSWLHQLGQLGGKRHGCRRLRQGGLQLA